MKNKCIDCNKKCSGQRCRKCQDKRHSKMMRGKNNNFYGKHYYKENHPNWKGNNAIKRKKYFCITCNKQIGYQCWNNTKKCRSCNKIGENNPMFGKSGKLSPTYGRICIPPKAGNYKNIRMRSSWEIAYAQYLDKNNIKWQYEPKTFDLGNTTYTPDFYLPEKDLYIEIKGQFSKYARNKIQKFQKKLEDINFEILKEKELKYLGII